jgi:uncharacterized membrane protein YsdA (DUF1294 family)
MKPLFFLCCLICAVCSSACLALCWVDKRAAHRGRRRVPERRLLALALCGGGAGLWLGMRLFRHKTRHVRFVIAAPLAAVLQLAGLFWLAHRAFSIT